METCSLCGRPEADHHHRHYLTYCSVCPVCGAVYENRRHGRVSETCSRKCGSTIAQASRRSYEGEANPRWDGGKSKHPLYLVYSQMISRCEDPGHKRYADYGGRGITVDPTWRTDFWSWLRDVGPRPEGVGPSGRSLWSLDRIDNDGNYAPGNVRWATNSQQVLNQRRQNRA